MGSGSRHWPASGQLRVGCGRQRREVEREAGKRPRIFRRTASPLRGLEAGGPCPPRAGGRVRSAAAYHLASHARAAARRQLHGAARRVGSDGLAADRAEARPAAGARRAGSPTCTSSDGISSRGRRCAGRRRAAGGRRAAAGAPQPTCRAGRTAPAGGRAARRPNRRPGGAAPGGCAGGTAGDSAPARGRGGQDGGGGAPGVDAAGRPGLERGTWWWAWAAAPPPTQPGSWPPPTSAACRGSRRRPRFWGWWTRPSARPGSVLPGARTTSAPFRPAEWW